MGVIFHKGKKYGGTGVKVQSDPAATSLNALDVPNGQTMTSYLNSKIGNFCIRAIRYEIANNTSAQIFNYPTGFAGNIIIAAKIETVYNSVVDYTYNGDNSYYGNVVYGQSNFSFTPKVAGNAKFITFIFLCWN